MTGRPRSGRERARNAWIAVLSAATHVALVLILASMRPPAPPAVFEPEVLPVMLAPTPGPAAEPEPPGPPAAAAASPAPPKIAEPPPPRKVIARRAPPSPEVEPIPAGETESETASVGLTAAELASAVGAGAGRGSGSGGGGGGGGGQCDMAEMLQRALRRDPEVRAAVAMAARSPAVVNGAILMWRDDWIRSHGQEGAGLAGVREAIMMEVAFAPAACRTQPMQGYILISLTDAPGSARLALGADRWRWSDLLLPPAMRAKAPG